MVASRDPGLCDWPVGSHIHITLVTGRMERMRIKPTFGLPFKRFIAPSQSLATVSCTQGCLYHLKKSDFAGPCHFRNRREQHFCSIFGRIAGLLNRPTPKMTSTRIAIQLASLLAWISFILALPAIPGSLHAFPYHFYSRHHFYSRRIVANLG